LDVLERRTLHAYSVPWRRLEASEEVVAEKNMKVTEKFIENMDRNRVIKGKTLDGKDFKISLEAKAAEITVIRVRIGVIGDNPRSKRFMTGLSRNSDSFVKIQLRLCAATCPVR